MKNKSIIAERLSYLRKKTGYSQEEVAKQTGIKRSTLANLEAGNTENPRKDRLQILADYYGVSLDYLYGRTDNEHSEMELLEETLKKSMLLSREKKLSEEEREQIISILMDLANNLSVMPMEEREKSIELLKWILAKNRN